MKEMKEKQKNGFVQCSVITKFHYTHLVCVWSHDIAKPIKMKIFRLALAETAVKIKSMWNNRMKNASKTLYALHKLLKLLYITACLLIKSTTLYTQYTLVHIYKRNIMCQYSIKPLWQQQQKCQQRTKKRWYEEKSTFRFCYVQKRKWIRDQTMLSLSSTFGVAFHFYFCHTQTRTHL